MTAKYDPALCERLIAETREADAATHRDEPSCDHSGCIDRLGLHDDACSKRKHRVAHVDGWLWKEGNLAALADQLAAARAEIARLRDTPEAIIESAATKLATAGAEIAIATWEAAFVEWGKERERLTRDAWTVGNQLADEQDKNAAMRPVVDAAERYRDNGACYAGIISAVDAYRAARDGEGGIRHAIDECGECASWCRACAENIRRGFNPDGSTP